MREFMRWIKRRLLSLSVFAASIGISLIAMCIWIGGVLLTRWMYITVFGFSMPDVIPFLLPLGLLSKFLMVGCFFAFGLCAVYRWDRRREKR